MTPAGSGQVFFVPATSAISMAPLSVVYAAVYVLQPLDPLSFASSPKVAVELRSGDRARQRVAGQEPRHLPAPDRGRSFVAEQFGLVRVDEHDLVALGAPGGHPRECREVLLLDGVGGRRTCHPGCRDLADHER